MDHITSPISQNKNTAPLNIANPAIPIPACILLPVEDLFDDVVAADVKLGDMELVAFPEMTPVLFLQIEEEGATAADEKVMSAH